MPETSAFRATTPTPPSAPGELPSWATLRKIASGQRHALLALLFALVVVPAALFGAASSEPGFPYAGEVIIVALGLGALGARIWMVIAVYRLAGAMGSRVALLWAIGAFLPNFIGLLVLAVASARATKRLRAAGLKVGLLGTKLGPNPPPGFLCQELAREFA